MIQVITSTMIMINYIQHLSLYKENLLNDAVDSKLLLLAKCTLILNNEQFVCKRKFIPVRKKGKGRKRQQKENKKAETDSKLSIFR